MHRQAGDDSTPGTISTGGVRPSWAELPAHVRAGIEDRLGSPVAAAMNQAGGFSPGLAARVRCADGRRAFVKAVGAPLNPQSPGIYRAEARVVRQLPEAVPVPRLRATYDDGDWVALVFDEIDGRMPHQPWRSGELQCVIDAVITLSASLTPCPLDDAQPSAQAMRAVMLGYRDLAADPPDDLDPWERRHLGELAELAESALENVGGDTLVHFDLRADNILLTDDRVWFVDWPWAFRGAAWIDSVMLLLNAAFHGHDPEPYVERHPLIADVDPNHVTAFLAGMAGFFTAYSRRPSPPGLPTLRAFQRAQHTTTSAWVRRRTGWP